MSLDTQVDQNDRVYRELQRHLDQMPVGFPATKTGAEIRLLKHLFTPEEAAVGLLLSAVPERVEKIYRRSKKLGISKAELERRLKKMLKKGAIRSDKASDGSLKYAKSILVIGMYEAQVARLTREFEEDFVEYVDEGFAKAVLPKETAQLRTVPVDISIIPERRVGTYDDIRQMISRSKGPFAVIECICKKGQHLLGGSCAQTENRETCLTLESIAERVIEGGVGRSLTQKETLELVDTADDIGFVLQPQNTQSPQFICFCCGCCCHVLRTANRFPRPAEYFNTNYQAEVDVDLCLQCGECASRCQMDALLADEGPTEVDQSRCIGCGLCVTTCPSEAIQLRALEKQLIPPKDQNELYMNILKERFGPWELAKIMGKKVLGMKI